MTNTPNKLKSLEQLDELSVPRGEWVSRVMRKHPNVVETRERYRPLSDLPSFARSKNSGKTEVREVLSDDVINMLIMQLFSEEHLDSTLQAMQKETGQKFVSGHVEPESLQTLLKIGIDDLKDLFGPIEEPDDPDAEVEAFRTYVFDSGEGEDTDIWTDQPDTPTNILVSPTNPNQLVAASLNKLILWLTNSEKHDMDFRKTFFMTYHSFTTADNLLNKLIQRYHVPGEQPPDQVARDRVPVVTVIKFWIDHYPNDFSEKLLSVLNNFIETTVVRDVTDWAKQLRGVIAKMDVEQVFELPGKEPPEPKVPKNIFSPKLDLDDVDEEEIARQLCLIDFEFYARVRPAELLLKSWERHKPRAPNVIAMIARYNQLVNYVRDSTLVACKKEKDGKGKQKTVPRFLRIAEHLRNLNNFLSLSAIMTGLTCSKVRWETKNLLQNLNIQQQNTFHELEKLISYENNYKGYRATYSTARPPCIPLIGIHLRDISFTEDCSSDKIDGLINWEKRQQLWRVISAFLSYQPIPYNYHKVHQIMIFLRDLKVDTEDIKNANPQDESNNSPVVQ